jgi:hypothetical protein
VSSGEICKRSEVKRTDTPEAEIRTAGAIIAVRVTAEVDQVFAVSG